MKEFETFFDTRVSMGRYQYAVGAFSLLGAFAGGTLLYLMNILPFYIQTDFYLDNKQLNLLLSSFQFGQFIGGAVLGLVLDKLGRSIAVNGCLLFVVLSFGVLGLPFHLFIIAGLCFVLGVYGSFTISGYNTLVSETFPSFSRSFWLVLAATFISFGRLWGALCAALFLSPYQVEFWRRPILVAGYVLVLIFAVFLFLLKESIKFLYSKRRYPEMRAVANEIYHLNRGIDEGVPVNQVSVAEIDQLVSHRDFEESLKINSASASLYDAKFRLLSFITFINFAIFFMMVNGHVQILAKIVGMDSKSLWTNVFIISGEVFGSFLILWLIEKPWLGGKRLIIFAATSTCIGFFLSQYTSGNVLAVTMFFIRICLKANLVGWTVYTAEAFPTLLKGKAFGISTSCAGVVNTLFPSALLWLFEWRKESVLWAMSACGGAAAILSLLLPSAKEAKRRAQSAN